MFSRVTHSDLVRLATSMSKLTYSIGETIVVQDEQADKLVILANGDVRRIRHGRDGVEREMDTRPNDSTLTALYATAGDLNYSSAKCVTPHCVAYTLHRDRFREIITKGGMAVDLIEGLSEELRMQTRKYRTPLLAQKSNETNFAAVTVAATAECYYRSALNSIINQRLSGISIPYFPNMHVQVPARIAYIGGLKGCRGWLDREVDPDQWPNQYARQGVRLSTAIAPGVLMTPVSSILEACNVVQGGSAQSIVWRATRGWVPRCAREIIFGVGLNQLSDYFEERFRSVTNAVAANTFGSLTAGVIAGYFSHVPHNISTYKLMSPEKSYSELFKVFVDRSVPDSFVPKTLPQSWVPAFKAITACLAPKAFWVRTVQICGSFAILNSLIQAIEGDSRRRIRKAVEAANADYEADERHTDTRFSNK